MANNSYICGPYPQWKVHRIDVEDCSAVDYSPYSR